MQFGIENLKNVLNQDKRILSVFVTAGFPKKDDTVNICLELEKNGADLIEIGVPFSDPIADGETIQQSSDVALKQGITLKDIFLQVTEIRKKAKLPILLMGYYNPILQFGIDEFLDACRTSGVDGLIIPDLPIEEYSSKWEVKLKSYGISLVFLITPSTKEERIKEIDSQSTSFIYAVSSFGVTGGNVDSNQQEKYYSYLKSLNLKNPVLIGFGIRDAASFKLATNYLKGAIIGSEFIRKIKDADNLSNTVRDFVSEVRS